MSEGLISLVSVSQNPAPLPVQQRNVFTVDYAALEVFITDSFMLDWEYSIPADIESDNDTSYEVYVDGKVDEYDRGRIRNFLKNRTGIFMLDALMNYLCLRGRIQAGDYVVRISW
jgi:hypothetical protein